jgi:hypothetical protein
MSDEEFDRRIAGRAAFDRRAFIKKMVVGAAFAAPAVASFNMLGLGTAQGLFTSNTTGCGKLQKELQALQTAYAATPPGSRTRAIIQAEEDAVRAQMYERGCF